MKCDIAIIGGGAMGVSAAFWLTKIGRGQGGRIVVFEPDPSLATSSTALSVASVRQQFSTDVNIKISRFGIDFIRNFQNWTGAEYDLGLRENGYLFLTTSSQGHDTMRSLRDKQNALGASTTVLDAGQIATRFPWLATTGLVAGSLGSQDEGWFDNIGLVNGMKSAAQACGVSFVNDRVTALTGRAGEVSELHLSSGEVCTSANVVTACGTHISHLMECLNEDVPVEPRKRTVFVIHAPDLECPGAPLVVDPSGFYLRPEGRNWICAIVPQDDGPVSPDDFNPEIDVFEETLWPKLWHRVPKFERLKVLRAWAGHYAFNRFDQNALVGRHPRWRNLFMMNGFSGHGLQQAPAIGRGVAELILTGSYQSIDLSDLCIERLEAGSRLRETEIV